jgi:hypothetical protein
MKTYVRHENARSDQPFAIEDDHSSQFDADGRSCIAFGAGGSHGFVTSIDIFFADPFAATRTDSVETRSDDTYSLEEQDRSASVTTAVATAARESGLAVGDWVLIRSYSSSSATGLKTISPAYC